MRRHLTALGTTAIALSAVSACHVGTSSTGGNTEPPPNTVVDDATGVTVYTPEFQVPPGDSFTCFYMNYKTAEELSIIGGDGIQGQGGHHILLYYATDPRPVDTHPCDDAEMTNLNQISGSAGKEGQVLSLPPGLAIKVPAGKQLVVQAHYINITGKTQTVRDWVKMEKGIPSQIHNYVNYFVTDDEGFQVPPSAPLTRTTECVVDRDYQLAISLPHMHEYGSHFTLEVLDANRNHLDTPIDTTWSPVYTSHPPIKVYDMSAPYLLKKGQILRQTCAWNNTTTDPLLFPREMCVGFMYYWPGAGDITCNMTLPPSP